MKSIFLPVALVAAGLALPAAAGDAEDLKAMVATAQEAYNACDADTMQGITHEDFFGFNADGSLTEGNTVAEFRAQCEAGVKFDFKLTPAKIHSGDGWAVIAGNTTGTVTSPEGESQSANGHFTVVAVKEGDAWKSLHLHTSPDIESDQSAE